VFCLEITALQPRQLQECQYPTNYSDFTLILINNTLVVTGGNTVRYAQTPFDDTYILTLYQQTLQVWTRDLSNGFDIHQNCWTVANQPIIDATDYQPYKNGIGFKSSDTSFAIQAGDSSSPVMSNLVIFDLVNNAWSTRKFVFLSNFMQIIHFFP
jgi:hypothetical protein